MKKNIVLLALAVVLTACQDPVRQIAGTYSYKISGRVTIDDTEHVLTDEMGAMDIVHISADSALLTFNSFTGPAYYTIAIVQEKSIELEPYERDIQVGVKEYHVSARGSGDLYDETIIIQLQYSSSELEADELTLLCKKN